MEIITIFCVIALVLLSVWIWWIEYKKPFYAFAPRGA